MFREFCLLNEFVFQSIQTVDKRDIERSFFTWWLLTFGLFDVLLETMDGIGCV